MQATALPRDTLATIRPASELLPSAAPLPGSPTLEKRLEAQRHRGVVQVSLGWAPSAAPVGAGTGATASARGCEAEASAPGFPVLRAGVIMEGESARVPLGWLELVNARDLQGNPLDGESTPITLPDWTDLAVTGRRLPPEFFEAPTGRRDRAMVWEADLFLCTLGVSWVRTPARVPLIEPLLGLRWGFRIVTDGAEPMPLVPRWTGDWAWASWVPVLRKTFPTWQFADRAPSDRWADRRGE